MQFDVEVLYQKSKRELRSLFSSIPKTEHEIELVGYFIINKFGRCHVAETLAYLPKHITKIVFGVRYCFTSEFRFEFKGQKYLAGGERLAKETSFKTDIVKSIGGSFPAYLASLPSSVVCVYIRLNPLPFQDKISTVSEDLFHSLKMLPSTVKTLGLSNLLVNSSSEHRTNFWSERHYDNHKAIHRVFRGIPPTVTSLTINNLPAELLSPSVFSALSNTITTLVLKEVDLYELSAESLPNFLKSLPKHLNTLDLSDNLLKNAPEMLVHFFSSLSSVPSLKKLQLRGNNLSSLPPEKLAQALSVLPPTIEELDLGNNGILGWDKYPLVSEENPSKLEKEFSTIMSSLPKTIILLGLSEKKINSSIEQIERCYASIPSSIKTIDFSDSLLLPLTLPNTVEGLRVDNNNGREGTSKNFIYFFKKLPSNIQRLSLRDNSLIRFNPPELDKIFTNLPPFIKELDISENRFDRLPYSQMQAVLKLLPPRCRIITGSDNFKKRNDGALVPYRGVSQVGFFNPKPFYHQARFAELRIVMSQLASTYLNLEVVLYILSLVLNASESEMSRFGVTLDTIILSSLPPKQITLSHEKVCLHAVSQRIIALERTDTCLDLSRCGLNRLNSKQSQENFEAQLASLPKRVTTLNLRGNGFLHDVRCQGVFATLMQKIPNDISCLDLSSNDFEHQSAEELTRLFLFLPRTVQRVTLDHEKPIAPLLQIANRNWPARYFELTKNLANKLEEALALLNDYIKQGLRFWKFVYGHCNQNSKKEAALLAYSIKKGLITCPEDLQYELEQIIQLEEESPLAKLYSFLFHQSKSTIKQSEHVPQI